MLPGSCGDGGYLGGALAALADWGIPGRGVAILPCSDKVPPATPLVGSRHNKQLYSVTSGSCHLAHTRGQGGVPGSGRTGPAGSHHERAAESQLWGVVFCRPSQEERAMESDRTHISKCKQKLLL